MGDSGGGITLDGTGITTDLTGSSYDGHGSPSVGFIIGMVFWNITTTGGLVGVLCWLYKTIFETDEFFKSNSEIVWLSFFTLVWVGIGSIPGIILTSKSTHVGGFILGLVNLSCSGIPVLVFLLAVIVNKARLHMAASKASRIQAARDLPGLGGPPSSVPSAIANC